MVDFEFRDPFNPTNVFFDASVDYAGVQVSDGLAVSGNYMLTTTVPTTTSTPIPYSIAYDVDLSHILPVTP